VSDLRDLYQEVILDHSRKPRNFRVLQHFTMIDSRTTHDQLDYAVVLRRRAQVVQLSFELLRRQVFHSYIGKEAHGGKLRRGEKPCQ